MDVHVPRKTADYSGAGVARPDRPLSQLVGLLKVRRRIPPLIAVPTTAGTGSETTIAAVVTGSDHHKYAISDLCLIPRYAILDPALTIGLPPHITAETGMAVFWFVEMCALALPSMVLALLDRELPR